MSRFDGSIFYHENRRDSRIIPLQSYGNPPSEEKFSDLDYVEFKLNNVSYFIKDCIIIEFLF